MKKLGLLFVFLFTAIIISAQDAGYETNEVGRKVTFEKNKFSDNWFIGLGAGGTAFFTDFSDKADFQDLITFRPSLFVGKWFNPYLGGRFTFAGGALHTFDATGTKMSGLKYLMVHYDFMFNATNYYKNYKSSRVYNFIPYAGIGYAHGFTRDWGASENNTATVSLGFLNTFRLSNKVSLFIDIEGTLTDDQFSLQGNRDSKVNWDGMVSATGGITFNFGKQRNYFVEVGAVDQTEISRLNGEVNTLRQTVSELSNRPVSLPDCPECPESKVVEKIVNLNSGNILLNPILFPLNSAAISAEQEFSIFHVAKFLKDNPTAKVKVAGYADAKTGNPSINKALSEKRVDNVVNTLVNKYNISRDRLIKESNGDLKQPYDVNDWNRVVIVGVE